jgi:hypothetical protein
VGGAVVFWLEGMKAHGACDTDVGFSHRHTVARFGPGRGKKNRPRNGAGSPAFR